MCTLWMLWFLFLHPKLWISGRTARSYSSLAECIYLSLLGTVPEIKACSYFPTSKFVLYLQQCNFMEFPFHHHTPALTAQCTFFFFFNFSVVLIPSFHGAMLCSHSRAGTSGSEEPESTNPTATCWGSATLYDPTLQKPKLCQCEIEQLKML